MSILASTQGPIRLITINRPHASNAVDHDTALDLHEAFRKFGADDTASVAILTAQAEISARAPT